jgi:hypothetical protein
VSLVSLRVFPADREPPIELRDSKDLMDLRIEVAKNEPTPGPAELLVKRDQRCKSLAVEVLDLAKTQEQRATSLLIHLPEQVTANRLHPLEVEDRRASKTG